MIKVAATELALKFHGVKHHHSYNSQDYGNKLYPCVFNDSSVTEKVSCAQTKSEALVTRVLLSFPQEKLLNDLKIPILN